MVTRVVLLGGGCSSPPPHPRLTTATTRTRSKTRTDCLLRPHIAVLPVIMLHLAVSDSRLNLPKQVGGRPWKDIYAVQANKPPKRCVLAQVWARSRARSSTSRVAQAPLPGNGTQIRPRAFSLGGAYVKLAKLLHYDLGGSIGEWARPTGGLRERDDIADG